ncbi:hypothetical protein GDO81_013200 [Engystomops pustulosus]|uniref:Uncharacterized protein n=1 Tax=Engystomops pustulosus TaxID=76066 RepID=A0AAV7B1Z6_ENGPU|nr:hypothetical protein GDO81_013200 [Engystomops pustulosus]
MHGVFYISHLFVQFYCILNFSYSLYHLPQPLMKGQNPTETSRFCLLFAVTKITFTLRSQVIDLQHRIHLFQCMR